ncbi:MAG: acylase [Acidimicrobiales bacterium]|nr:acylase [Hyphomonadaceae bacterium]RZV42223.1 MAG: acylase [Acidimicrobiales bacterium]
MRLIILMIKFVALSAVVSLTACSPELPQNETDRLFARAEKITIVRDDFGVPHIYAKTDADAVFGLLYAQAEDDFPRIERNYIWATGRLAEIEGESALYSDLRARLYMTVDEAKAAYENAPQWIKDLCDAYADGLNHYLASNPDVKPKLLIRFEPWMPMFFSEGSIGGDIEQIPLSGIKAFYADGTPRQAPEIAPEIAPKKPDPMEEPGGSNGFAISGDLTRSGNAMLLINPHTSFYFRGEVHVVSEEGLNAYGAVTWGQFFVYQGFNENNGWMHTSTYLDFMDEFVEQVYEEDGKLLYRYGNENRPVKVSSVKLKYKDGDAVKERTFPTYHTHHGPITHISDGKWVATKINWDPVNALKQSFLRTKTKDHDEFREMMDIRTNSSNNTVYADNSGNIAYYHGNFVPKRDTRFDYSKPVDGSNPATDWNGIHTVDESITLLNPKNGWIQNCNSTPFTAALEFSPKPENYPAYMAPDPENFRGLNAVRVLKDQKDFTLDKLIDVAYDPYLPAFEVLIPSLLAAYDSQPKKDTELARAIDVLRKWDFTTSKETVAMSIAHYYGNLVLDLWPENSEQSRMEYLTTFSANSDPNLRVLLLSQSLDGLVEDFGSWETPWGEISRFQRPNGDIKLTFDDEEPSLSAGMASAVWGALAAYGQRGDVTTKRIYGTRGNSFVAVVEFGDKVKAKTLLAGGQSGDPASPHFYDQAQRYVDHDFKDVAYYKDDVLARAQRTYYPGE